MNYYHTVLLTYTSLEELSRHMRRLIEKEQFMSMGQQPDFINGKKVYGFIKDISESEFQHLAILPNKDIQTVENTTRVLETRDAW